VRVIVLALTLAIASFAFALVRSGEPNTVDGVAEEGEVGSDPVAFPSLAPNPTPVPPPAAAGPCVGAPVPRVLTPAEIVPAPTADYRFQHTLKSSVGAAPDLVEIGNGGTAFTDEERIGRSVLSFAERTGLSLSPTTGVISRTEFTIEILFRLDHVSEYRKILDLKDGSRDSGLYVLDGCLIFSPRASLPSTLIEPDTYVQVVLTRGSSDAVVGYVDGIRQFVFDDEGGIAKIGGASSLRFFVDDSRSKVEFSSGAVSQIRLYDRELTTDEIAALACSDIRLPLANSACPASLPGG
jgi:Concanavalin A-like lectin/glucanases superfamily